MGCIQLPGPLGLTGVGGLPGLTGLIGSVLAGDGQSVLGGIGPCLASRLGTFDGSQ
jgi:hypothetical protein